MIDWLHLSVLSKSMSWVLAIFKNRKKRKREKKKENKRNRNFIWWEIERTNFRHYLSFFLPVGSRGLDVQAELFRRAVFAVSFETTPFAGLSRCYDEIYPISRRRQEDSVASLPGLFGRLSNGETEVWMCFWFVKYYTWEYMFAAFNFISELVLF